MNKYLLVTCLVMLASASLASADSVGSVNLDFIGIAPSGDTNLWVYSAAAGGWHNTVAGPYQFTLAGSSAPSLVANNTNAQLFCIELKQYSDPYGDNADVPYSITHVEDAPGPPQDPVTYPNVSPMGAEKALLLEKLIAQNYFTLSSLNDKAAFQLAVWEIVHEYPFSTYDVTQGNFYVNQTTIAPGVAGTANSWLATLGAATKYATQVYALSSVTNQDYLYIGGTGYKIVPPPAPEPATIVNLLGLGALGFVALWRRRKS